MNSTLEEIWSARAEISKACGYDVRKLLAYYQQQQEQHKDRIVRLPRKHTVLLPESSNHNRED